MEDRKLIIAVCLRPVLYNTMMVSYRDRNKKERAWVDVAEDTGFPVDVCRRKWKSLRDRYMRHKKSEQEGKKSGSAAGTVTRWKFAGVLSFLDPFVTPRETSSNLPRGAEEAGPAPRTQSGTKRKRARVPEGNNTTPPNQIPAAILQALQSCANITPLSGIEHYVLGLVPSLVRMPPEVLEYVKFQISKVIFDNSNFTLNLEPV
ncbi:unnamed protein product [Boreogadus saida]